MRGPGGGGPAPPRVDARSKRKGSSPPTGGCEVLGGGVQPPHGLMRGPGEGGPAPPRMDARSLGGRVQPPHGWMR
eukprot:616924-Prorocentrum_minimum.AAC.1